MLAGLADRSFTGSLYFFLSHHSIGLFDSIRYDMMRYDTFVGFCRLLIDPLVFFLKFGRLGLPFFFLGSLWLDSIFFFLFSSARGILFWILEILFLFVEDQILTCSNEIKRVSASVPSKDSQGSTLMISFYGGKFHFILGD